MWRVIMIIKEPIYIMANYLDFFGGIKGGLKSIDELRRVVGYYMRFEVDGDKFNDEQDFENEVRKLLKAHGFKIQDDKHNVENAINEAKERLFAGRVEDKIPDIVVECAEGLVFLELKFKNTDTMYNSDIEKVQQYRKLKECAAAGVLFLDEKYILGWLQCQKNKKYYYYWDLR